MQRSLLNEIFQNKNIVTFFSTIFHIFGLIAYLSHYTILCVGIISILFIILIYKNMLSLKLILFWVFIFYLGFLNALLQIKECDNLIKHAPAKCQISGQVKTIPKKCDRNTKFYFNVEEITINGKTYKNINSTTLVTVKIKRDKTLNVNAYDYYTLTGFLKTPYVSKNPSQFNYANYLKNFDTFTVFYINEKQIKNIQPLKHKKNLLTKGLTFLNNLRERIIKTHAHYLKSPNYEILGGIVFGDDAINPPEEIRTSFINSGLLHILAASGMNVAFIYGFWYFLLNKLKIPYKLILTSGIFMIILYALMTGLGASVIRASFMLIFILIGKLINRDTHSVALLSVVALLMLLYNPAYIKDISFQLSFLVTFGLLICADTVFEKFKTIPQWLTSAIAIPIIAQIWVIPLQIYYFNSISLYSILANILTVPFLSIVSFLGFLSSVLSIIEPISNFVCMCIDFILNPIISIITNISDFFGNLKFSLINIPHPSLLQMILYYALILVFTYMLKKGFANKKLNITLATILLTLFITFIHIPNKNMELITFDVQNADAFLLKTPNNKYFIIDTGKSGFNGGNSQAETTIINYLKDKGIYTLEGIIITHFDNDHSGGAVDLMKYAKVKKVYINSLKDTSITSKEIYKTLKEKNIETKLGKNNEEIYKEKDFKITTYRKENSKDDNENSIISIINHKNLNILMMGDANMNGLQNLPSNIQIIKVGHHGARNVLNTNVLNNLKIKTALISTGLNPFGHPDLLTLNQLKNINTFRTDKHGAIKISSNGNEYKIYTYDNLKESFKQIKKEKI